MVFDVDKLKEADWELAVRGLERIKTSDLTMDGFTTYHGRLSMDETVAINKMITAARMVVAGQPLSFCAFHVAAGDGSLDCWGAGLNGQDDCRMVEGWWMPTGGGE